MRSWALVLSVVAGCGRLGFDDLSLRVGDGGGGDIMGMGSGTQAANDGALGPAQGAYLLSGDGSGPTSLLSLDLTTGEVRLVGTLDGPTFGVLGGLANVDPNTFFASGNGKLVKITLSPFAATTVATFSGNMTALEKQNGYLLGITDNNSTLLVIDPANPGSMTPKTMDIPLGGGDLVDATFGNFYYFSNVGPQLYIDYSATGHGITQGSPAAGAPSISGLVADSSGRLFAISDQADAIIALDKTTGQLGLSIRLCGPCPGTPYNLLAGDATTAP